jgi:hypothetical protein
VSDLPVRKTQPPEIQTQNRDLQRLPIAGQNRVGEIVEASPAVRANMALTLPLRLVMAVARDMSAAAL